MAPVIPSQIIGISDETVNEASGAEIARVKWRGAGPSTTLPISWGGS